MNYHSRCAQMNYLNFESTDFSFITQEQQESVSSLYSQAIEDKNTYDSFSQSYQELVDDFLDLRHQIGHKKKDPGMTDRDVELAARVIRKEFQAMEPQLNQYKTQSYASQQALDEEVHSILSESSEGYRTLDALYDVTYHLDDAAGAYKEKVTSVSKHLAIATGAEVLGLVIPNPITSIASAAIGLVLHCELDALNDASKEFYQALNDYSSYSQDFTNVDLEKIDRLFDHSVTGHFVEFVLDVSKLFQVDDKVEGIIGGVSHNKATINKLVDIARGVYSITNLSKIDSTLKTLGPKIDKVHSHIHPLREELEEGLEVYHNVLIEYCCDAN